MKDNCLNVKYKGLNVSVRTSEKKVTPEMQKNVGEFVEYVRNKMKLSR